MANGFEDALNQPISNQKIIEEIEASNEKEYLKKLKKKNKDFNVEGLNVFERERIAKWIKSRYEESIGAHNELCDRIDEYDDVWRMVPKPVKGDDGDMPTYRTPLSTVSLETIHADFMNVFFTPQDFANVLPTEEGDIPKVQKLGTFMNWSLKNELNIFEKVDQMFHSSGKNGECPYIMHWVKEYGTIIKREPLLNPANRSEPLYDPDTQEPLFQETDEEKLLYNGPKLEVFSRKDYIQPKNAMMGRLPDWEMRKVRITYDKYLRAELKGEMYAGSIEDITDWRSEDTGRDCEKEDYEGDVIPTGAYEKEFIEFYGRMRVKAIKTDSEDDTEKFQELEDEFIGLVNLADGTLCSFRKNRFPLKERPIGIDYFIPDDDGRRIGMGVMEAESGNQQAYDALFNQFIFGTVQSNNPFGFFTPLGNMKNEPLKIKNGFIYPTSDPSSVNIVKMPQPDGSIITAMELVQNWAQLLFGISSFTAGVESTIDPTAPAKKAELIVAEGNVRRNTLIKRKIKTLKDIIRRWYLLYKENLPPNKFMRITGEKEHSDWSFKAVTLEDFALKGIPDFELTGNVLNANKALVANKRLAIFQVLMATPAFAPQTREGLNRINALTKWLVDGFDEEGLVNILPKSAGEFVQTPEEENARFMQGDIGEPSQGEDHINHLKVHRQALLDPTMPDNVKEIVAQHINQTVVIMKAEITQQAVMAQVQGGSNAQQGGAGAGAPQAPGGVLPQGQGNMARPGGGGAGL